jgi:hypothetical protein
MIKKLSGQGSTEGCRVIIIIIRRRRRRRKEKISPQQAVEAYRVVRC